MDLSIKNTYAVADDTLQNMTSLMQCTDAQRLSLDEMTFGEFTTANVPTLLTGSYATVNGALTVQAGSDGTPLYIANAQGSTFQDVSAAPEATTLYLCLIPSSATAVTYALKACASIYFDAARRGFYETGTQNRVFGECRKVSGSWPASYKRLYTRPEVLENYLKMFSDGLEINARKVASAVSKGRVATAYSDATARNWTAGTTQLFKFRADYPCMLEFVPVCKTYISGIPPAGHSTSATVSLIAIDDNTAAELGAIETRTIGALPDTRAAAAAPLVMRIPAGTFAIKLTTVVGSATYNSATGTYGLHTDSIIAYIRNPFGNRLGEWGAVL